MHADQSGKCRGIPDPNYEGGGGHYRGGAGHCLFTCSTVWDCVENNAVPNSGRVDCSTYVSWVLIELGLLESRTTASGIAEAFEAAGLEKYIIPKAEAEPLQPGDILVNRGLHIQINGEDKGEGFVQYNGGSGGSIRKEPDVQKWDGWEEVIRLPFSGSASTPFEGYEPGQYVVSPASGELIEYGITTRRNVETGEEEEIGYAMIKVLPRGNAISFLPGSNDEERLKNTIEGKRREINSDDSAKDQLEKLYTEDQLNELGYYDFYFSEYSNQAALIEGYIVYIDGFEPILQSDELNDKEYKFAGGKPTISGNNINVNLKKVTKTERSCNWRTDTDKRRGNS